MKRYQSGKSSKKGNYRLRRKPKRLKIDDLLLPEPKRRKRHNKDVDGEEDLEFTPTLSITKPNGDVSTLVCEEASESETKTNEGEVATATIYTDVRQEFWKDTDISWETVLEFQKIL